MSNYTTIDGDKRYYNTHLQSSGTTLTGATYSGLITIMKMTSADVPSNLGDAMYITSAGRITFTDADASTSMPCMCLLCESGGADAEVTVLLNGFMRDDSWSWTPGNLIYISTNASTGNTLTETAPSGTGDQVQVAGIAYQSNTIYFKPDFTLVEI